jgi:hypothetical protein
MQKEFEFFQLFLSKRPMHRVLLLTMFFIIKLYMPWRNVHNLS